MAQVARKERSREEILRAAARGIAKHGFHGMSMRELARETGKGLATFYNHFSSKEELLFELQRQAFSTLLQGARESLSGVRDPAERLRSFIVNHVQYFIGNPEVMQVLVREAAALPPPWRKVVRELKESYFEIGREVVTAVHAPARRGSNEQTKQDHEVELERSTYNLFGMLNWVYGWYEPSRHGDPRDVAQTIHRMTLHGLSGDPPTTPSSSRP